MIFHKIKYVSLLILMICVPLFPQQDSAIDLDNDWIENYISELSGEGEDQNLYDVLDDLQADPVNINSNSAGELQRIPFINLHTAALIINYRKKHGAFNSVNDLYKIGEIDSSLIKLIAPFVIISKNEIQTPVNTKGNNIPFNIIIRSRISDDLWRAGEYEKAGYPGSPFKIYNRAKVKISSKYELGFTTEKDPGEKNINDLTSFRLMIKNTGPADKIVLGDYVFESGQGLALWGPYGLSKSGNAVSGIRKTEGGIKSYRSTDENRFLRGAAASLSFDPVDMSLFYSSNRFDAVVDPLTNTILSEPSSGYHRTETELSRRKNAEEKFYGVKINYKNSISRIGFLYYHSSFGRLFEEDVPQGKKLQYFNYYSLDYDVHFDKINLFGETVFNGNSAATLNGFIAAPGRDIAFTILFRHYPWKYFNLHGSGFGEKSVSSNETGFYTGIRLHTFAGIINFYYDVYKFPYAVYGIPSPSGGSEAAFFLSSKISKLFELRFRIKLERKDYTDQNGIIKNIFKKLTSDYRVEFIAKPGKLLRLKGRIEYKKLKDNSASSGQESYMIFQEIRYSPLRLLSLTGRLALFRVPAFDAALYEYEYDLPGIFYNSLLLGEGMRWYLLASISPFKNIMLSIKYSVSILPEYNYGGFGNDLSPENYENRIGIQADIRF